MQREPTHRPGDPFKLGDEEVFIPETCLADKIWNWLWNEAEDQRQSTYYLWSPFHLEGIDRKDISAAYNQLIEEERAYLTPAGFFVRALFKEPPGWFDK